MNRTVPIFPQVLIVIAFAAAVAVASAQDVRVGVLLAGVPALLVLANSRRDSLPADSFFLALGGSLLLGYGFSNVPLIPGVPFPLPDLFLMISVLLFVSRDSRITSPRLGFLAAKVLIAWAIVRLAFDYSTYGTLAIRDMSQYFELLALWVGYWTYAGYDRIYWRRFLTPLFVAITLYSLLFPMRFTIAAHGPIVGLQQPVYLFGWYSGIGTLAAFFYFVILRPYRTWISLSLAALSLPAIAMMQLRGQYLALFAGAAFLLVTTPRLSALRWRLVGAIALAGVALIVTFSLGPAGRLGRTSPTLFAQQILTLTGAAGPGAGSFSTREGWARELRIRIMDDPSVFAFGLGLGADLTGGFSTGSDVLVRKPHNDYLEVAGRLGVPALVAFLILIASAFRAGMVALRRLDSSESQFVLWALTSCIALLVLSATQPFLSYSYGTLPLFGLLGACLAAEATTTGRTRTSSRA